MTKLSLISLIALFLFQACAQEIKTEKKKIIIPKHEVEYVLNDFLKDNEALDKYVNEVFEALDDTAIVAQLIMPAVGKYGQTEALIKQHIKERVIGGVLMLNGTKDGFKSLIKQFELMNDTIGNLPFLYSADAEPSLMNMKIKGSTVVKKANEIKTIEEVQACAKTISSDLNYIGINYNFSPVVDMSSNSTVGYRGFGSNPANIIPWSNAFIQETQNNKIIATAKHFPGHGLVSGDTHKSLQMIDGELKEIKNYPELIDKGVLSIMVAHIAVKNNPKFDTKGLPSTLSEIIVQQLLRDSLGFKGLIVTDAMNMGGVVSVPESAYKAVNAGCDILLMPVDAKKSHSEILKKYKSNPEFKAKVDASAKRIIRMKICTGLLKK
jgi:beta-N-acetylhexosaminidase